MQSTPAPLLPGDVKTRTCCLFGWSRAPSATFMPLQKAATKQRHSCSRGRRGPALLFFFGGGGAWRRLLTGGCLRWRLGINTQTHPGNAKRHSGNAKRHSGNAKRHSGNAKRAFRKCKKGIPEMQKRPFRKCKKGHSGNAKKGIKIRFTFRTQAQLLFDEAPCPTVPRRGRQGGGGRPTCLGTAANVKPSSKCAYRNAAGQRRASRSRRARRHHEPSGATGWPWAVRSNMAVGSAACGRGSRSVKPDKQAGGARRLGYRCPVPCVWGDLLSSIGVACVSGEVGGGGRAAFEGKGPQGPPRRR